VATISYLGKGNKNGHGDELDREKIEGLRLQNAISRTKLAKLSGDVLDRRQVEFVVSSALVTLRQRILALPGKICAGIHGLNNTELHTVRMQVERVADGALEELADTLGKTVNPKAFIDELAGEDAEGEEAKAARIRKETQAKAKRTAKRHEKQQK
jgi:hypothetical protein